MKYDKPNRKLAIGIIGMIILFLLGGLMLLWASIPAADAVQTPQMLLVSPQAKTVQTIEYIRCGHEVQKRVDVPAQWAGQTKEGVQKLLPDTWRITSFDDTSIHMTGKEDLFCPQHWVLMLDEEGGPAVFKNRYGNAMEKIESVKLEGLNEASRQLLVQGLAFQAREEIDEWIQNFDPAANVRQ